VEGGYFDLEKSFINFIIIGLFDFCLWRIKDVNQIIKERFFNKGK
jgi:hypothetical protein